MKSISNLFFITFLTAVVLLASCINEKGINETLVRITPVKFSLELDSTFEGENINWNKLLMKVPMKPVVSRTITDTVYVIKYTDSSYISIIREPYNLMLELLQQQAQSNTELRKMLEEKKFETDYELLKYIYSRKPDDNLPWEEEILKVKLMIMANGSEKGIREITSPDLKGFQYCIGKCSFISYDIYLGNHAYKIISSGIDQQDLVKMISTFRIDRKDITP